MIYEYYAPVAQSEYKISLPQSLCADRGRTKRMEQVNFPIGVFLFCLLRPFFYGRWTCFHFINLNNRGLCVSATMHKAEVRLDSSAVSKRLAASGSCTKSWRSCRRTCVAGADWSAVFKRVAASGSRRRTSTAATQFTSTSVHVQKASKNKF